MCLCSVENEYTCCECEKRNTREETKRIALENARWYQSGYDAVCAHESRLINGAQSKKSSAALLQLVNVREYLWLSYLAWVRVK